MSKEIESGDGYRDLGMAEEARKAYAAVPPSDPDFDRAQGELTWLSSRTNVDKQSRLGDEGLARIRAGHYGCIYDTALCLHLGGRTVEAYRLIRQFQSRMSWSSRVHYGMACYASRIGRWSEAAWHLILCLKKGGEDHMFFDLDLEPLYRHAADGQLEATLALAIAHPLFEEALNHLRGTSAQVDDMMESIVPPNFRAHLIRYPSNSFLVLSPRAPEETVRSFKAWRDAIGGRLELLAAEGIRRAREFVLESQLAWAAHAASMGDYFAARYHTVLALARRPNWFDAFERRLAPLGMGYLIDDIRKPLREEPTFCAKVLNLTQVRSSNLDLLEDFSPAGRRSGFVALIEATILHERGDVLCYAQLLGSMMCRWPRDPAAFANAIMFAARANDWDKARRILSRAPPSIHHLRLTRNLVRWVASKDAQAARVQASEHFYGQPDIGGVVRRLSPVKLAFLGIRGTEFCLTKKIRPFPEYSLTLESPVRLRRGE